MKTMNTNNKVICTLITLIVCVGLFGFTMTYIGKVQNKYQENLTIMRDHSRFVGENLGMLKNSMSMINEHENVMRKMAYHQAISQMEQEYPEAVRHNMSPQEWQYIVEQRQTEILNDIRDDLTTH